MLRNRKRELGYLDTRYASGRAELVVLGFSGSRGEGYPSRCHILRPRQAAQPGDLAKAGVKTGDGRDSPFPTRQGDECMFKFSAPDEERIRSSASGYRCGTSGRIQVMVLLGAAGVDQPYQYGGINDDPHVRPRRKALRCRPTYLLLPAA
jgi:hypothetical protein